MTAKIKISWNEFDNMIKELVIKLKDSGESFDGIYGIPRGGLIIAVYLSHQLNLPLLQYPTNNTLVVDDISDEGKTLSTFQNRKIATLFSTTWTKITPNWYVKIKDDKDSWLIFPWENLETENSYDNKREMETEE